jgi:hypothetical protein
MGTPSSNPGAPTRAHLAARLQLRCTAICCEHRPLTSTDRAQEWLPSCGARMCVLLRARARALRRRRRRRRPVRMFGSWHLSRFDAQGDGFLAPGQNATMTIPSDAWLSARIWGRTDCNWNRTCVPRGSDAAHRKPAGAQSQRRSRSIAHAHARTTQALGAMRLAAGNLLIPARVCVRSNGPRCRTGDCGFRKNCQDLAGAVSGNPPVTLAEFTLGSARLCSPP